MVTKERLMRRKMDLVEGRDYVVNSRAVKKAVKRYEKANAEKLATISLQEEYLACFTEYIKKYRKSYYNSIHEERRI
jgi:hypothetical protein